jgi:hypothetical protein
MTPIHPTQSVRRHYARRLPSEFCRRAMLSIRVSEAARCIVKSLAEQRDMSASEYLARLIADHIALATRTNSLHIGTRT